MARRKSVLILLIVLVVTGCRPLQAAPFIEEVDPPVLRRGSVTRVTLRGTDLHQAVGVWLSLPTSPASGSVITASTAGEATLDVTVPVDAPLGMHGLRLATRSGLSNVHIVLIEELPISSITHATKSTPVKVDLPCTLTAECRPERIDRYQIAVTSGQTVAFEVIGSRFGKNYDPVLTVRDESGRIVARRDNDPGLFYDCRFAHTFESPGHFTVEVQDARYAGDATWNYVLRMGNFPATNVALPSAVRPGAVSEAWLPEVSSSKIALAVPERPRMQSFFQEVRLAPDAPATWVPRHVTRLPNDSIESEPNNAPDESASRAAVPGTLNGVIDAPGDVDCYAMELTKGQSFEFTGVSREMGSAADLELVLFDPDGREVRRVDDVSIRIGNQTVAQEARFPFNVGKDGLHCLMVRDLSGNGGPSFAYRIDVAETGPVLKLEADVASLTVPRESWQPVPIKVTRVRLTGPVELKLFGAPPGVTIEPTTIPPDATEIVCRIVATTDAPDGLSTIEIVGHCQSEDGQTQADAVVSVRPMIDRQLINKDRILYALRDNQLRHPPSLRSRLALMITPPAPFELALPDAALVLTKYQTATFPIKTRRRATVDFTAPIVFQATGGQIGVEEQERDNVFAKIPDATIDQPDTAAVFYNRINTRYEKTRVRLVATSEIDGHTVTLVRTFDLDVRSAFKPTFEPSTVTVEPGGTATIKLLANRTPTHDGEVLVFTTQTSGLEFPAEIVIPAGQSEVEFSIPIPSDVSPRRYSIRCESKGNVGRYEEHLREPALTIDVKKPQ